MRKLLFVFAACFTMLVFTSNKASASHIAGYDYTWENIGQDSFLVTLNLYRDCDGISMPNSVGVSFTNGCGNTFTETLPQISFTEVSQLCPDTILFSSCQGGTLPGMEQYVYQAIVVIPPYTNPLCNDWTLEWTTCCRNGAITNGPANASSAAVAQMNLSADSLNNSPVFNAQPIPYVCQNQLVNYNYGVTEPDGDSLVYSFACGFSTNANTPLTYTPPYTCTAPIPGINIDPATGQITFTPTIQGNFVVVVRVEEYDPVTGLLKAVTYRDIQMVVIPCSNTVPDMPVGITNFFSTGGGQVLDSNSIELCVGDSIYFEVEFIDPDGDSLLQINTIEDVLPGAELDTIYNTAIGDTMTITVSWVAQPGMPTFNNFIMSVFDDACPVPGMTTVQFDVSIIPGVYAGPDQFLCQNSQTAFIAASGGSSFTWQVVLPGSSTPVTLTPGTNYVDLSPSSNGSLINYPAGTSPFNQLGPHTLIVTSNLIGSCDNVDSIVVNISPDYTLNMSPDTLICPGDSIQIGTYPSNTTINYSYDWTPKATIGNDTVQEPWVTPVASTTYEVEVTSQGGCVKQEDVVVNMTAPFPDSLQAVADPIFICLGETGQLGVEYGNTSPLSCGLNTQGCNGLTQVAELGNQTVNNTTSGYPAVYAGSVNSARTQILIRANELHNMGMQGGGTINGIAFDIVSFSALNAAFNNFTIKMACTSEEDLDNGYVNSGLVEVFSPQTHNMSNGWNNHAFPVGYNWDGVSNLVIDVCYTNTFSQFGTNAVMNQTSSIYSTTRYTTSSGSACGGGGGTTSTLRPNIRFDFCSGVDPNNFLYNWSPALNLSATNVESPDVTPTSTSSTTYLLTMSDPTGTCFDTSSVTVGVVTSYDPTFTQPSPLCISDTGAILVPTTPGGVFTGIGVVDDTLGIFDGTVADSVAGPYAVTYTVSSPTGGCASDTTINVVVTPLPDASITSPLEYCATGGPYQLTAATPGGVWSGLNVTDPNLGTYDPNGQVGNYYVKYTLYSPCFSEDSVLVKHIQNFIPVIDQPDALCAGDTMGLTFFLDTSNSNAGSGPVLANWSGNNIVDAANGLYTNDVAGTYPVILNVTDLNGACGGSDTVDVLVNPLPDVTFPVDPYCSDDMGNKQLSPPVPPTSGIWNVDPIAPTTDTLDPLGFIPALVGEGTWLVSFSWTDVNGCTGTHTDTVRISNTPGPVNFIEDEFCVGDSIVLYASSDNADSIYWYFNPNLEDSNLAGIGSPISLGEAIDDDVLNPINLWAYEQNYGCPGPVNSTTVIVNESPDVAFTMDYLDTLGVNVVGQPDGTVAFGYSPFLVDFTATNVGAGDSLNWYFQFPDLDGANVNKGTAQNVNHTYLQEGDYIARLVQVNTAGCTDYAEAAISVWSTEEFYNVFTPNGDGYNDVWYVEVTGIENVLVTIYNRWGKKVYDYEIPLGVDPRSVGWDGTVGGKDAADGTYFYVVSGTRVNGEDYVRKGTVTLLRNEP